MILLQKESVVNQVIPDKGGLANVIRFQNDATVQTLKVGVNIEHPFIGDLKVSLTSPAGTTAVLHNRAGGSSDNLNVVFEGESLNVFDGESTLGDWTLSVEDFAPRDEGSLVSWNLDVRGENKQQSEIYIPEGEDAWLVSEQYCAQNGIIEEASVTVNIEHPFINDLMVKLSCPDGTEIMLHNRQGGSTDNINMTYGMDVLAALKGKNTEGVWSLMVKDAAPRDSGTLKSWSMDVDFQEIDDLTQIEGITPEHVSLFNSKGIYSVNKLSTLGTAGFREVLAETEGDFDYDFLNGLVDRTKAVMA